MKCRLKQANQRVFVMEEAHVQKINIEKYAIISHVAHVIFFLCGQAKVY